MEEFQSRWQKGSCWNPTTPTPNNNTNPRIQLEAITSHHPLNCGTCTLIQSDLTMILPWGSCRLGLPRHVGRCGRWIFGSRQWRDQQSLGHRSWQHWLEGLGLIGLVKSIARDHLRGVDLMSSFPVHRKKNLHLWVSFKCFRHGAFLTIWFHELKEWDWWSSRGGSTMVASWFNEFAGRRRKRVSEVPWE